MLITNVGVGFECPSGLIRPDPINEKYEAIYKSFKTIQKLWLWKLKKEKEKEKMCSLSKKLSFSPMKTKKIKNKKLYL